MGQGLIQCIACLKVAHRYQQNTILDLQNFSKSYYSFDVPHFGAMSFVNQSELDDGS